MVVQDIKPSKNLETREIIQMTSQEGRTLAWYYRTITVGIAQNNLAWSETETCLTHLSSSFSGGWRRGVEKRDESRLRWVLLVATSLRCKRPNHVRTEQYKNWRDINLVHIFLCFWH